MILGSIGKMIDPAALTPARSVDRAPQTAVPPPPVETAASFDSTLKPPPPASETKDVNIATLLAEYKNNEVRADGEFKGPRIRVTGIVSGIKQDLTNSIYVTIGTGRQFETPEVQCFFSEENRTRAAALNRGQKITVTGNVWGLMMNVIVKDCEFVAP